MNLFDGLEKLITEHGSASVMRERLTLAREQYDAEIGKLKEGLANVSAERDSARAEVLQARAEIEGLRAQLKRVASGDDLEAEEVTILKILAQTSGDVTADDLAPSIGMSIVQAQFYLTQLEQRKFVAGHHFYTGQPSSYELAHAGRGYLVRKRLA